jgi:hypothetical protein
VQVPQPVDQTALAQGAGKARLDGAAQPDDLGDDRARPPALARPLDLHHQRRGDLPRRVMGSAGAVFQRQQPLGGPGHPFMHGPITHSDGPSHGGGPLAGGHPRSNQSSTVRRGPGILVHVHPRHLPRVGGRLATTTIAEKASRMDILLRLHTQR